MATVDDMQAELTALKAARDKILASGQEYAMADFRNRRGDLKTILDRINTLEIQIARATGSTTTQAVFARRL